MKRKCVHERQTETERREWQNQSTTSTLTNEQKTHNYKLLVTARVHTVLTHCLLLLASELLAPPPPPPLSPVPKKFRTTDLYKTNCYISNPPPHYHQLLLYHPPPHTHTRTYTHKLHPRCITIPVSKQGLV